MYRFKLNRVEFNDMTSFAPKEITVLVGPNNSGKSRALKDIVSHVTRRLLTKAQPLVIKDLECSLPDNLNELRHSYNVERYQDEAGTWLFRVLKPTLCEEDGGGWSGDKWPETYAAAFQAKAVTSQWFLEYFGRHLLTYLSTEHRLQLVKESRSASFKEERANLLQEFYYSGKKPEQQVREIVREEFGQEIALDFSVGQKLLLRVANDFSSLPADPREALPVLSEAAKLDEQGDGIRSFVGMVVAVLAVKRDVILIDEPEAFLHPPQAFRIGEFLSEQANQSRQFIVATHSADVLRGILAQRHSAVSIIRLDRVGDKNSFSILEPNRVRDLVTDPILTHLVS